MRTLTENELTQLTGGKATKVAETSADFILGGALGMIFTAVALNGSLAEIVIGAFVGGILFHTCFASDTTFNLNCTNESGNL